MWKGLGLGVKRDWKCKEMKGCNGRRGRRMEFMGNLGRGMGRRNGKD